MRSSVVLVRHAQPFTPTPSGPGDYRRSLTEAGKIQADQLTGQLAEPMPQAIFSSPYLRAVQTIEPIARLCNLPIHTNQKLREWDSGIEPTQDYARHYNDSWTRPRWARPGGESLHELTERAVHALTEIIDRSTGSPVIVGSHGTFISGALIGFGCSGIDWAFHQSMPMPAIYRLEFNEHRIRAAGPGL